MAHFENTVLLNALSKLQDPANKDTRAPAYGVTRAFNDRKKNVILNYDEFAKQDAEASVRTMQIDYLGRDTETVNSTRAATLTGAYGTSTRDSLTWVTYSREFTLTDGNMRNNTLGPQMLANQIKNARLDIGEEVEDDGITKLEAFRNPCDVDSPHSVWDDSGYVNQIANADEDRYLNIMDTETKMRNYNGNLQIINYGTLNELFNWQAEQGVGNSSNLQFQYGNKMFYTSNNITNPSDYIGVSYVVEEDSIALVDWIPAKNREGLEHDNMSFTAIADPFGIFGPMALAVQQTVADTSGNGEGSAAIGSSQDAVWMYELSIDVAYYIPTLTTGKLVNKYGWLTS